MVDAGALRFRADQLPIGYRMHQSVSLAWLGGSTSLPSTPNFVAPHAAGMLSAMLRFVEKAIVANLIASLYCGGMPMTSEVSNLTPSGRRSAIIVINVALRTPPPEAIKRSTPKPVGRMNSLNARAMASALNAVMVASLSSLDRLAYLSSIDWCTQHRSRDAMRILESRV